ncbi:(2Fe-2S)-binding protein [Bacillus mesophilus]
MDEKKLEYNFAITYSDHPNKIFATTLSNLTNPLEMKEFVSTYSNKLRALTPQVAATYFCKYYGWVLAGFHYFHSLNYKVDMSPSNIELQLLYDGNHDHYGLVFKLVDSSIRSENREQIEGNIKEIYFESVLPLLQAFVSETGVRIRELWGQLCIGLHFGYDLNMKEAISDVQKYNLQHDFTYLTKKMEPNLSNVSKNPLDITFQMIPSARDPETHQRMKPSCCLYYLTEASTDKCYSCPRMSAAEREVRRLKIMENAN